MKTILALICPPLAVVLTGRPLTAVLTLALTLLFWVPGMIHAMLIVSHDFKEERDGAVLPLRKPESNGMALLALVGLLSVIAAGGLAWPAFKGRYIDAAPLEPDFVPHAYR